MLGPNDGAGCKIPLGAICVLVVQYIVVVLHLTQLCRGQSQLVGPAESIVAIAGDDAVLPCHLDPAVNAADMTVEWTRADLVPRFVHVWRDGVDLENKKHAAYKGRTSLAINNMKLGDVSLKLSKVKLADRGSYKCFVPALNGQARVDLFVGSVSSLIISLMRNDKISSRVVLQCESAGWYPEPELLWLDGEGNLLPAGPPETLRGPDDLYTVSSRVTVEKRHGDNITCRVQQRNIKQSREAHIHVPGDFFNHSCSSAVYISSGMAAMALLILAVVFLVWKCHLKRQGDHVRGASTDHTEVEPLTEKRKGQRKSANANNLDEKQEKLKAKVKAHEEDKLNLIMVVLLLMAQRSDLENDIAELKLKLQKVEDGDKMKPAKQTGMRTASEEPNDKMQTNIDTRKKELEQEIEAKESQLKSVMYGVDVMTETKKELDDAIAEICEQLEKIKQTEEVQIQFESGFSEA